MSVTAIEEFDLDNVEVPSTEKFKVDKNIKYRIGFPLLNASGNPRISKVTYFTMGDNDDFKSWRISDDEAVNELAKKNGAELQHRYITAIINYRCDRSGKPILPLTYEILPVVLGDKKVNDLKAIHQEYGLGKVDLSVTSDNPKFQAHTYIPLKSAFWAVEKPELLAKLGLEAPIKDAVIESAELCAANMADVVAYKKSDKDILEMFKGSGASLGDDMDELEGEADAGASINPEDLDEEFAELDI